MDAPRPADRRDRARREPPPETATVRLRRGRGTGRRGPGWRAQPICPISERCVVDPGRSKATERVQRPTESTIHQRRRGSWLVGVPSPTFAALVARDQDGLVDELQQAARSVRVRARVIEAAGDPAEDLEGRRSTRRHEIGDAEKETRDRRRRLGLLPPARSGWRRDAPESIGAAGGSAICRTLLIFISPCRSAGRPGCGHRLMMRCSSSSAAWGFKSTTCVTALRAPAT